ncbi:hypothetical protein QBZ16_005137 [Prototheca wickerhamii]|uniref:Uncharacterized protein n=1 Tax=Prototheca wickerhamii TaxID=3111 RepID=A0AAD9IEL9_PROWI|nr:hypothetical protein QBZ16_005137 [Prototheca wickerhamii]
MARGASAGPKLLFRQGGSWQKLASLAFAYDFGAAPISALFWTPSARILDGNGLLVLGSQDGTVWVLDSTGTLLARSEATGVVAAITGLTAWFQPGILAVVGADAAGRVTAHAIGLDKLSAATASRWPVSLDVVAEVSLERPSLESAARGHVVMRVLPGRVGKRRGPVQPGMLAAGPVRLGLTVCPAAAAEGADSTESPCAVHELVATLRLTGPSELRGGLECADPLLSSPQQACRAPQSLPSPGLAFLPHGILTETGDIVFLGPGPVQHSPCDLDFAQPQAFAEDGELGRALPVVAAASTARGDGLFVLSHSGQVLRRVSAGRGRNCSTAGAPVRLRPGLGAARALAIVGGDVVVAAGDDGLALFNVSDAQRPDCRGGCSPHLIAEVSAPDLASSVASATGKAAGSRAALAAVAGSEAGRLAASLDGGRLLAAFHVLSASTVRPPAPPVPSWVHTALQTLQGIGLLIVVGVIVFRARSRRGIRQEEQRLRKAEGLDVPSIDRLQAFEAALAGRGGAGRRRRGGGRLGDDEPGSSGAGPGRARLLRPPARTPRHEPAADEGQARDAGTVEDADGAAHRGRVPAVSFSLSDGSDDDALLPARLRALALS